MDTELDRLRDVARAAVAWVRAQEAYHAHLRPVDDAPDAPWPKAYADELHRLAVAAGEREAGLVEALARLAEVAPGLFDPTT